MESEDISFRAYRPSDVDALYALDRMCFAASFRFSRRAMQRFAEARGAWTIVAEAGGVVAGFCIVHLEGSRGQPFGYVVTIDVAPAFEGRGVGRQMLERGELWARKEEARAMMLHVWCGNARALRFYERGGYERAGDEADFYGPGMDAAVYSKLL